MTRLFVILLVLVLASSSIGHKVLKVPIKMEYIDDTQVVGSTANLHSDLENVELRDVTKEYEIDTAPNFNTIPYIEMYYPDLNNNQIFQFMLDTNSSWMTTPIRGCSGTCLEESNQKIPKQFHDCEEQVTTVSYESKEANAKLCKATITPKKVPWFYATNISMKGKSSYFSKIL